MYRGAIPLQASSRQSRPRCQWAITSKVNKALYNGVKIKVIRSLKRRKTISARLVGEVLELRVPRFLPLFKVNYYAALFAKKFAKKESKRSDSFLQKRARLLSGKYLKKRLPGYEIAWSSRQTKIFGICNKKTKSIKISARLKRAPSWVIDYVVLHELAHLLYSGHGKDFWGAVTKYPKTDLAKVFLRGVAFGKA